MTAAKATKKAYERNTEGVIAMIEEAIEEAEGITIKAVENLYSKIIAEPEEMRLLLPKMVKAWCVDQIGMATQRKRTMSFRGPAPCYSANRLNAAQVYTALDFPLPGGKRLGSASADEVLEGARFYEDRSEEFGSKGRFLRRVHQRMGNAHRVEDVLTDKQVEELQE